MSSSTDDLLAPGLGQTQRQLLLALKRRGPSTLAELGVELTFAPATLREHLQALEARRLVDRRGMRRAGPGRPEVVYALAAGAHALFPRGEPQVLRELAAFLVREGHRNVLEAFCEERLERRRAAVVQRLAGLGERERLTEAAKILSEYGFMAQVRADAVSGEPVLRLSHCPLRELVAATDLPCRCEAAFVEALVGRPARRAEYLPAGDAACAYEVTGVAMGEAKG